jgi:hypothetical protein
LLNDSPFKDFCMVLKISKTTYRCTKRLPGGEHTWVGLNSPVINTPGWWLLGVFGISLRAGFQKNFLVTNRPGSQDSHVYWSWGCLDSLAYFVPAGFFVNQFKSTPWCIHHWGVETLWWIHQGVTTPQWWIIKRGVSIPQLWIPWGVNYEYE